MKTKSRARLRVPTRFVRCVTACLTAALSVAPVARAQETSDAESLVRQAIAVNSTIRSAAARVTAARERVSPAGVWPDPMLMLGIINVPLGREESTAHGAAMGPDPMTMKIIGVEQTVPFPGKLSLARRAASAQVREAEAELARARLDIQTRVRQAYYDAAFHARALVITDRNAEVLSSLISASEARYVSAGASQVEVLNARLEATRLGETASELVEARRGAVARLNALLQRPTDTPVRAEFPQALIEAAAPQSAARATFVSSALGARAANSPLKTPQELQALAQRSSPDLMRRRAFVEAEQARAALSGRAYLPDVTAALEYGQRTGLPDMVSARISVPLPGFKRRKQDRLAASARIDVVAAEAELAAAEQELFGRIAEVHADLERQRTRLALYVGALIPQGQATVQASLASFQAGRTSLFEVLGHQAALFRYETEYFRALADFARGLAELEQIVGTGVLR